MDPALLLRAPAQARSARPARAAPSPTKAAAAGASDEDSDGTSALPASTWKRPYSRRPQKDPNAPPHSRSAYALFMDVAKREEAAGASGAGTAETTAAETKTTLAARWKALSAEERARYDQLAAVERAQYNAALAAYTNTEPHRVRPVSVLRAPVSGRALFRAARCFGPSAVSGRALFRAARCFGPRRAREKPRARNVYRLPHPTFPPHLPTPRPHSSSEHLQAYQRYLEEFHRTGRAQRKIGACPQVAKHLPRSRADGWNHGACGRMGPRRSPGPPAIRRGRVCISARPAHARDPVDGPVRLQRSWESAAAHARPQEHQRPRIMIPCKVGVRATGDSRIFRLSRSLERGQPGPERARHVVQRPTDHLCTTL